MRTLAKALSELLALYPPSAQVISSTIDEALSRVVATAIFAPIDVPNFDNSAMDGYAINYDSSKQTPFTLTISQRIKAGDLSTPLAQQTAARIFTGAMIPDGANTVVIQEHCTVEGDKVTIDTMPTVHQNIRRAGDDIAKDSLLFERGHKLNAVDLGLLASIGRHQVDVFKPLKIALLSTGSELIAANSTLQKGKIYNSNSIVLTKLCEQLGYQVVANNQVSDSLLATETTLKSMAEQADVILSTGGVSVGEEDYIKTALQNLGTMHLWKIAMKPGKPLVFGSLNLHQKQLPFFGLPGNPVSMVITFKMVIKPLLASLQGEPYQPPPTYFVTSNFAKSASTRQEFIRVTINRTGTELMAQPYPNQSSGVLSSIAFSDGVIIQNIGQKIEVGDRLSFISLDDCR